MKNNHRWIIIITVMAFILTIIFSLLSTEVLEHVNVVAGILILLLFIIIGILFDIIGVAVASSTIKPFHAMASKKVKGADKAKKLIENSDKVSSICNDVIGDVCGIISGAGGIVIAEAISAKTGANIGATTLITTSVIASLTIGGKALGKGIAVSKSEYIVTKVIKLLSLSKR